MIKYLEKYIKGNFFASIAHEMDAAQAYDMWSDDYDCQPENLMLALDEEIVCGLIDSADIEGKSVVDIGCGTGRHWDKILSQKPSILKGYDVSEGMLKKLEQKYPGADVQQVINGKMPGIEDGSFDVLLSTLTIAHIAEAEKAIQAWSRMLKPRADIILTDFHPDSLAAGGRRTFSHRKGKFAITNYVHSLDVLLGLFGNCGFRLTRKEERRVDEAVKHVYAKQNALPVYKKFKGMPIIYGLHLRRGE